MTSHLDILASSEKGGEGGGDILASSAERQYVTPCCPMSNTVQHMS